MYRGIFDCVSLQAFLSRIESVTGFVPTTMENVWIIQDILLVQVQMSVVYIHVTSDVLSIVGERERTHWSVMMV